MENLLRYESVYQAGSFHPHLVIRTLQSLRTGTLEITLPEGNRLLCQGTEPGVRADINFYNPESLDRIAERSDIGLGEGYMLEMWDTSDLKKLLQLMADNCAAFWAGISGASLYQMIYFLKHAIRANTQRGSRKNIHAHYDLSNDFYKLWLDETMTYSGALFHGNPALTLEAAQRVKYRRILDRLYPRSSDRILDIGCGWGGFMEEAAKSGVRVTGITISKEQADFAKTRLEKAGLDGLAEVRLQDYRDLAGQYDHVVSIGMVEHVGEAFWPVYMAKIYNVLKSGGKAMIRSIVVRNDLFDDYRRGSDFIREHIFPGGMLPSSFRLQTKALGAGLEVNGIFRFGKDYAITLEKWLERFERHVRDIRSMGYDEQFIRKWRFYLAACAAMFRAERTDLIQAELRRA
jgi:cyclopropane-fatty-acyl-phospholipid synthase